MINVLVIVVLRFIPLLLLFIFCLMLFGLVKGELVPGKARRPVYYLVVDREQSGTELPRREIQLIEETVTIGRSGDNQVVLPDPYVSGQHARIEQKEGELWLIDLGSTNGTFVNGKKVKGKVKLKPEDSVIIGGILFKVEKGGEYADSGSDPRGVSKAEERR
ncbi:MAG TPA: FHA domain-containing protein [Clostridia bacterium]|nr:FHA domain-containing protein [Clostridia bacterium]